MPGVTEQEIAQAKQMNLYQYMQLCEPDNFKPEGPGQFRHKGHSSLTFAEDGSWTYFKTKATGRTALNYLIAVEGVSFVEAVREINRIQGGVRPSFQPVKAPSPPAEKKPAKEFRLPKPDKNNYAATAYLQALHSPQCADGLQAKENPVSDELQGSSELCVCRARWKR